jgi:hypothetical protein
MGAVRLENPQIPLAKITRYLGRRFHTTKTLIGPGVTAAPIGQVASAIEEMKGRRRLRNTTGPTPHARRNPCAWIRHHLDLRDFDLGDRA